MLSMCDMGSGKTLGLRKKLKKKSREKEDRLHINQPRLFYHFILSCFFSLVISFSTYFWVAPPFQAVLFVLWMTARELTRLLVFVAHAYKHMWKKDLQLRAFAEQRWLFIPSFPRAEGLFLKGAYRAGLGGMGRLELMVERRVLFKFLFKSNEPSSCVEVLLVCSSWLGSRTAFGTI